MSVTVDRATNGWIVYADAEPLVFVTFEGVIDFIHARLGGGNRALDDLAAEAQKLGMYEGEHYFETCCGTCGANPESD